MAYTIAWGDDAKENYRAIAIYLLDEFGFDVADRFTDMVGDKLRILEHSPFIGRRLTALPSVRKLPLESYNTLYYSIVGQQVCLLNILDSRRGDQLK
jgi:plasmid stabilization system protein ParE